MEHSLLGTRRVISSIFTLNFFVTRIKQPMTIATNRMCISRNGNCVNTMCFPRQRSRQLQENSLRRFAFVAFLDACDTSSPIGELPFNFLLCDEFLKTYYLSMPQLSKYVSIRPNEKFRKLLQSWRSRCLAPTESSCWNILRPPAKRMQINLYEHHFESFGERKNPPGIKLAPFGERKARYGKYWALFSAECTIGMVWGFTALKHYANKALWSYGTKV